MKALPLLILLAVLGLCDLHAAPSPPVTYGVLNTNDFRVTNAVVSLRGSAMGGTNSFYTVVVSNLFTTNIYATNLYVTNIDASVTYTTNLYVTNLYATTEYVTNLYVTNLFVTYQVVSNIVAGNIQGTPPHLAMFRPDNFSVADSIVTQNSDTNGVTVNGAGEGSVKLGPDTGAITLARISDSFYVTNQTGMNLSLSDDGTALVWGHYSESAFTLYRDDENDGIAANLVGPDGFDYGMGFNLYSGTEPESFCMQMMAGGTNIFDFVPRPREGSSPAMLYANSLVPVTNTWLMAVANRTTNMFTVAPNSGYSGTGTKALTDNGTYQEFATSDSLWTNLGGILQPKDLTLPIMVTNQVSFSQGMTNLLFANGVSLLYTNSGSRPNLQVYNTNGYMQVGMNGANAEVFGGAVLLLENKNGKGVYLFDTTISPTTDNDISLSGPTSSTWFRNVGMKGTNVIAGLNDGLGNLSQLSISHGGTNGYILFSSQAAGANSIPRPSVFDRNIGALMTGGATDYVDMFIPTQTNQLSGALTFSCATNGLNLVHFTHVRFLFNPSGSDRLITLPATWHNVSGATFTVTNNTMAKLYVESFGDTTTSQTNVISQVTFLP